MAARHTTAPLIAPGWSLRRLEGGIPHALRKIKNPATVCRIVTAAERIFAEHGLAGARTEEIAQAARVNKAPLYYYFGSKEDLHRFVLESLFSQLLTAVEWRRPPGPFPGRNLRPFVTGIFVFF